MKKAFTLAEVLMPKRTSGIENKILYSRESEGQAPSNLNKKSAAFTLAEVLMPKRTSGIENRILYSRESEGQAPSNLNKKSAAFTLAEVLITIAIIGIVAALTIPAVVHKYQQQVLYTQFMKARADLNDALQLATAEKGFVRDWIESEEANIIQGKLPCRAISEKLKASETCMYGDKSCFAPKYKNINGQEYKSLHSTFTPNNYSYILDNGMSILMYKTMYGDGRTNLTCAFYVDVNGQKGPNVFGRDLFSFFVNKDYNIFEPFGYRYHYMNGIWRITDNLGEKCKNVDGLYCGGYLLQNGKMDY